MTAKLPGELTVELVGVLPDNRLLFVLSKEPVNFYELAKFFQTRGCKNALYLDGFVSRLYQPENNYRQMEGSLGVLIAIIE